MSEDEFMQAIREVAALRDDDPEVRHGSEDGLLREFLDRFAADDTDNGRISRALAAVLDEDVSRWYA